MPRLANNCSLAGHSRLRCTKDSQLPWSKLTSWLALVWLIMLLGFIPQIAAGQSFLDKIKDAAGKLERTIQDVLPSQPGGQGRQAEPQAEPEPARQSPQPSAVPTPSYSQAQVREAQSLLNKLGYDAGPVDGQYGSRTGRAISAYQNDQGLTRTAIPTEDVLDRLRSSVYARGAPVEEPALSSREYNTNNTSLRELDSSSIRMDAGVVSQQSTSVGEPTSTQPNQPATSMIAPAPAGAPVNGRSTQPRVETGAELQIRTTPNPTQASVTVPPDQTINGFAGLPDPIAPLGISLGMPMADAVKLLKAEGYLALRGFTQCGYKKGQDGKDSSVQLKSTAGYSNCKSGLVHRIEYAQEGIPINTSTNQIVEWLVERYEKEPLVGEAVNSKM